MSANQLPACGIYRTEEELAGVPGGRLVYFHNHGDPGPGIYLPERWELNRAVFQKRGFTLAAPVEAQVRRLSPLPAEGFYRVTERFHCCEKNCRRYEPGLFVQLGYDGNANGILFLPERTAAGIAVPESGTRIDPDRFAFLERLRVFERRTSTSGHDETVFH